MRRSALCWRHDGQAGGPTWSASSAGGGLHEVLWVCGAGGGGGRWEGV